MPLLGSWGSCVRSHVIISHLSCVLSPVFIVPCTQCQQGKLLPDKCVIDFQSLLIVISSPNPMTSKIQWWQRDCSLLLACDERQSGQKALAKVSFTVNHRDTPRYNHFCHLTHAAWEGFVVVSYKIFVFLTVPHQWQGLGVLLSRQSAYLGCMKL